MIPHTEEALKSYSVIRSLSYQDIEHKNISQPHGFDNSRQGTTIFKEPKRSLSQQIDEKTMKDSS